MRITFRSNTWIDWITTQEPTPVNFFAKRNSPPKVSPASRKTFATWLSQTWPKADVDRILDANAQKLLGL
jgi:hypothetical protein